MQTPVSSPLAGGLVHGAILQNAGGCNTGITKDRTLAEAEAYGKRFATALGATTLDALRAVPAEQLVACVERLRAEDRTGMPLSPVIDGYVLTEGYDEAVDHGAHLDIPYMIGCTENGIGITPAMLAAGEKSRLYCGCIDWSLKNAALGRKPAYVYYFTHKPLGDDAGSFHCAELR